MGNKALYSCARKYRFFFSEKRKNGIICGATPPKERGEGAGDMSALSHILRHNNYLSGLGRVNVHDKILLGKDYRTSRDHIAS